MVDQPKSVRVEITDEIDLHHFSPKDFKTLIPDYLHECLNIGITEVRIIHGKGIGNLRRSVHSILERLAIVSSFSLASQERGSWGATIVTLRRVDE